MLQSDSYNRRKRLSSDHFKRRFSIRREGFISGPWILQRGLGGLLAALACFAAVTGLGMEGSPAPSNVPGREYPHILPDLSVVFQVTAPQAKSVQLAPRGNGNGLGRGPYEFSPDPKGTWSLTVPPVQPGFHYYELVIDGFHCNDPNSETFFGWGRQTSGLEVPDPKQDFYEAREVPHGEVHALWYHSRITGKLRRIFVYIPPGYDHDLLRRYPVLYLQHGAGESERAWSTQGRVNFILDNLLSLGDAEPMLIVMDNGYASPAKAATGLKSAGNEAFPDVVVRELLPLVDRTFRTLADRDHRAIAGFSMGAGQAMEIALANPGLFAWVGAFSGGFWEFDPARSYDGIFDRREKLNDVYRLIWLGNAEEDPRLPEHREAHELLTSMGVRHTWFVCDGSHEWQVGRKHLQALARLLFRTTK